MSDETEELEELIEKLEDRVEKLEDSMFTLVNYSSNDYNRINSLEAAMTQANAQQAELDAAVAADETALGSLNEHAGALDSLVANLQAQIVALGVPVTVDLSGFQALSAQMRAAADAAAADPATAPPAPPAPVEPPPAPPADVPPPDVTP